MIAAIREPLTPRQLTLATVGLAAAVALYCVGYAALAGRQETLGQSLLWSAINVAPWVPALELAKRARNVLGVVGAVALGFTVSLLLGLVAANGASIGFEAWRRVPALLAVAAIALAFRWDRQRVSGAPAEPPPLLPRQIEWVQAAGNYVELRANGRIVLYRRPISALEQELKHHGFVRIHRSMLVRRDCIARIRPNDVVLADGTHLKVGKRYRAGLTA